MKKITQKTYIAIGLLGAMASIPLMGITTASAADVTSTTGTQVKVGTHMRGSFKGAGVMGTITSINGTTLVVTNKSGTAYTINASNAIVKNNGTTTTLSSLALGNAVFVRGTTTGTSVVATSIMTGMSQKANKPMGNKIAHAPTTVGTVSSVSGNTLTVNGKNSTVYTVDGTNAKVMKSTAGAKPVVSTLANVLVGDTVRVQGPLTGTSIVATNIFDGVMPQRSEMKTAHVRTNTKTVTTQ